MRVNRYHRHGFYLSVKHFQLFEVLFQRQFSACRIPSCYAAIDYLLKLHMCSTPRRRTAPNINVARTKSITIGSGDERQMFRSVLHAHYLKFPSSDFAVFSVIRIRHINNAHIKLQIFWQESPYAIVDRGRVTEMSKTNWRYRAVLALFHANYNDPASGIGKAEYVPRNLLVCWPLPLVVQMIGFTDAIFQQSP